MQKGLSGKEAAERLKQHGYNELPSARPKTLLRIASESIKEPMFMLLFACASLYTILGDYYEGGFMLLMVTVIISITFYQYNKTEKSLEALRKLSSPRALVRRDGVELRIPGREVVPGDILIVSEGDRVPADARILETTHLSVDESLLTGESVPVLKTDMATAEHVHPENLLHSGSMVVHGKAIAEATATGIHTGIGRIGASLSSIEDKPTRLQTEMKTLIFRLFAAGIVISIAIVVMYYLTRGGFMAALLNGMAAAMAILPEEFPMVLTVFLALGAWRLSQTHVLTRKPSVIETLGSASVLCSDKTGTITMNRMHVQALYNGTALFDLKDFNSPDHSGIKACVAYACQEGSSDPMEIALSRLHENQKDSPVLIKEYPFSRTQTAMSRVLKHHHNPVLQVYMKGAPETVFDLCHLSETDRQHHLAVLSEMAQKGLRVLGLAKAEWNLALQPELPEAQSGFQFEFAGFAGLVDPVRPEVPDAVKECRKAGVRVVMITGDYPATARSIARQAGIADHGAVMSGAELDALSDAQLSETIETVHVFARVVPEQKLRIVRALQARGHTVAMTGDGVNDAPALKAAHIGIAMGLKGTDVAREASSLVLLDDNFASIVHAVRMGRRIFDNLRKAMGYILAIHIPIIGLTMLPAFFPLLPILLLPMHIIFMELIIDPVCSLAFESEQDEKDIMTRMPRRSDEAFFGFKNVAGSLLQGFMLLGMVLLVYFYALNQNYPDTDIRAIAFVALITGNMALILHTLSRTRSAFAVMAEMNRSLILILTSALLIMLSMLFIPGLQTLFGFTNPGLPAFLPSVLGAGGLLLILELYKLIIPRGKTKG